MNQPNFWDQICQFTSGSPERDFELGRPSWPHISWKDAPLRTCLEHYANQERGAKDFCVLTLNDGTVLKGLEIERLLEREDCPI